MLSNSPIVPVFPVVDMERAQKFYEQVLGLKRMTGGPDEVVSYQCGNTSLVLYKSKPNKAEHTQAGFEVTDLVSEMNDLRARGLVFEEYDLPGLKTVNGVAEMGNAKSAWFKDSEGNIIAINQMV